MTKTETIKGNKQGFAINTFFYMLAMFIPKIAGFLILPILSRYILPEEFGIFTYTTSITGVLMILSTMGLNAFYLRYYSVQKDKKDLNGTIFWSMFIWNIFLLFISLVAMPTILHLLKAPFAFYPYMFLALLIQFFHSMEIIPMRTFRIRGEVKYYLTRILIKTVLSVVLSLIFIVGLRFGLLGRYYAEIINAVIFGIVFIVYMSRNSYLKINIELLRKALKFSLPIVPSSLVETASPMFINIIIERALSLSQLGIYSIGVTIASVVQMVTHSILLSVEPILYSRADSPDYPHFFKQMKNIMMIIVSFFSVACGLFAREATLLLLSEKYWNVWPIVQVLSISCIMLALKQLYMQLIIIQGRTSMLFWANVGYLITSALISFIMLPLWGESALGWANIMGFLVAFIVVYCAINKTDYKNMKLYRDFILMGIAISILFLSRVFHEQTIFISIYAKIIILSIFTVLSFLMYNISPRLLINKVLRKPKSI